MGARAGWSRRCGRARQEAGAKFADYFDFAEPLTRMPSHRILAMFRGEKEEVLDLGFDPESDGRRSRRADRALSGYEVRIAQRFGIADLGRPADRWLLDTVRWAWRTRILVRLGIDLRHAAVAGRRGRGGPGLRRQPARPAARRAGRAPGRRWGSTRASAPASRSRSSTPPARWSPRTRSTRTSRQRRWDEAIAILARLGARARRRARRDRQRHRLARDRQARRRADRQAHPELKLTKVDGLGGRRLGLLGLGVRLAGAARARRLDPRRGVDRPPPAGPARRAGEDRPEVDRRRPVPARPRRGQALALARRGRRGLRQRASAWTSTPPRRRCSPGSRASARRSPTTSSPTATATGRSAPRRALKDVPRLGPEGLRAVRRASCASAAATTRSTPPACTRRPTRWCAGSSTSARLGHQDADRQQRGAARPRPAATSSTTPSACRPSPTS